MMYDVYASANNQNIIWGYSLKIMVHPPTNKTEYINYMICGGLIGEYKQFTNAEAEKVYLWCKFIETQMKNGKITEEQ